MVKCADCGFLRYFDLQHVGFPQEGRVLVHADGSYRKYGAGARERRAVYCAERAHDLFHEASEHPGEKPRNVQAALVIQRERECEHFVEWSPALGLAEHRQLLDRRIVFDREDRRDREARTWRKYEFAAVIPSLVLIIVAAVIERSGQPTVVVNYPTPVVQVTPTP